LPKIRRAFLPRPPARRKSEFRRFEKSVEAKQILSSRKNSFALPRPHFAPPHGPNTWRAEPRKKNTLSFFKGNFAPAKTEMQGVFFLSGLPPSPRGGGGA